MTSFIFYLLHIRFFFIPHSLIAQQPVQTPLPSPSPPDITPFFFFNDTATTEIYTLSLHDALPILTGSTGPSDESGQTLTFVLDSLPSSGSLRETALGAAITSIPAGGLVLADATLFYTPAQDSILTRTFSFHVVDSGGTANGGDNTSPSATATLDITPVNDEPTARSEERRVGKEGRSRWSPYH